MTEKEFILEMLCSLPISILETRVKNEYEKIPSWLNKIEITYVCEAIKHYNDEKYKMMRQEELLY